MSFRDKTVCIDNILYKLDYLLDNTGYTLTRWAWSHNHLGRTFDEFMQFQLNKIPDKAAKHINVFNVFLRRFKKRKNNS